MASLQFVFGASGSGKTEYCIRRALLEAECLLSGSGTGHACHAETNCTPQGK